MNQHIGPTPQANFQDLPHFCASCLFAVADKLLFLPELFSREPLLLAPFCSLGESPLFHKMAAQKDLYHTAQYSRQLKESVKSLLDNFTEILNISVVSFK